MINVQVMNEINQVMQEVSEDQLEKAMGLFDKNTRIFITGAGRSGFQAKSFAMRLMHIGYTDFVIGETITPSIQKGDLWVAISGSGTTSGIVKETETAKKLGLTILAITSEPNSPLAKLADHCLIVPGATKTGSGIQSIQLLSTLFDQTVHITLDILALMIANKDQTSNEEALSEHVNIE